jgi:hypothetical protein
MLRRNAHRYPEFMFIRVDSRANVLGFRPWRAVLLMAKIFAARDDSWTNNRPVPIRVHLRAFAANVFAFGCGFAAL